MVRAAGHVAGSAATITLVAQGPTTPDARPDRQFDLGQATMSIMLAAADLGIGSARRRPRPGLRRRLLGSRTDSVPC